MVRKIIATGLSATKKADEKFSSTDKTPTNKKGLVDNEETGATSFRCFRRMLRAAVHSCDVDLVLHLVNKGININMVISDVFCDTALMCAVKYGYLEIVETLVRLTSCQLDHMDRNKQSALDEAIRAWLMTSCSKNSKEERHGNRYRIVKCLLEAGIQQISFTSLKKNISSVINTTEGCAVIKQLVRLFCEYGCTHVKSNLLSVLASYSGTSKMLNKLIMHNGLPEYYQLNSKTTDAMPMENAIILLRACAKREMLERINNDTSCNLELIENCWTQYRQVLRLMTLAGYNLPMPVLNYLYLRHASMFKWIVKFNARPKSLMDLARNAVRREMAENVIAGLAHLDEIPNSLKLFLLFNDL